MKFIELNISNFLAIGEAKISLSNKGLVLLQGDNRDDTSQDSNGAGKSTIPDALSWCLYGITAREESGDDVINSTVGKNCCVSTIVIDDKKTYRVSRHRKHKTNKNRLIFEVKVDEKWKDLTLGTDKLTQESICKLIGCSKEVFCAAIYAGQENLVDLPAMTDKFLKSVVEEAAGIDRLQRGHAIAMKKVAKEKGDLKDANTKIDGIESRISIQTDNVNSLKIKADEWVVNNVAEQKELMLSVKDLKAKLDAASAEDFDAAIDEVKSKNVKVENALDAANNKNSAIIILEGKIETQTASIRKDQRSLTSEEKKADVLKEKWIESKEAKSAACDSCGQDLTSDEVRAKHVATHRTAYDEQAGEVKDRTEAISLMREELTQQQTEHKKIEATRTDTSKLKLLLNKLSERHRQLSNSKAQLANLKAQLTDKVKALKATKIAKNPHLSTLEEIQNQIEQAGKELSTANEELKVVEYQLEVAEATAKVFSPAGVRAHLLDAVTPFLNDRTSHYLSTLSDGNISAIWTTLAKDSKGALKEKFSISVESCTGGKSFKSLSGGEKRKVRLSTYLALQDLVASRASKPIDLLIADEIDQAIDKSGLERLMSILAEKAKERGTAIVISHTDLKSWISDSVTIVKEGGVSRIEGYALA